MLLCIIVGGNSYTSYMNKIDYCKIADSSYHYHNEYDYYYIYLFFSMYGSACGCVRHVRVA